MMTTGRVLFLAVAVLLGCSTRSKAFLLSTYRGTTRQRARVHEVRSTPGALFLAAIVDDVTDTSNRSSSNNDKAALLDLLASTPANSPTSKQMTNEILSFVRTLEDQCPTSDQNVLTELGGTWQLVWTAQDDSSDEWAFGPLRTWINPLENQSYSNNPSALGGRSNPVLPRPIQDKLEDIGLIGKDAGPIKSIQAIDLQRQQVRNVVSFAVPSIGVTRKATVTVSVDFRPNTKDNRRIDVKFQSCRISINKTPINWNIPLGAIGPTGWLRTGYIDADTRITRGHKGSVFILSRG